MSTARQFRIAVTELAHFCSRRGDLNLSNDDRPGRSPSAREGQQGHLLLQQQRPAHYQREVSVQQTITTPHCQWLLAGRIDGIQTDVDDPAAPPLLEEIKTTYCTEPQLPPERHQVHLTQAQLYGALWCQQQHLCGIHVCVTYLQLEDNSTYQKTQYCSAAELSELLQDCCDQYSLWLDLYCQYLDRRDHYLAQLEFPFQHYRAGQRSLSVTLYRDLRDRRPGFYHAPTGLGKTIATLFPALRHLAEGTINQIWYLTAKNSGHNSVRQALAQLGAPATLRVLFLQARDKTCPDCSQTMPAGNCPAQQGYYDRLPAARLEFQRQPSFLDSHLMDTDLLSLAQRHQLCPHQLARDLLPWVDLVVADYNYVFDPYSSLTDALTGSKQISLLVDEAHNLPERARTMFSAALTVHTLQQLQDGVTDPAQQRALKSLRRHWRQLVQQPAPISEFPPRLIRTLQQLSEDLPDWFARQSWLLFPADLFEQLMQLWRFARRAQELNEEDAILADPRAQRIQIFCSDPAPRLQAIYGRFHSSHFFSGSLLPLDFFQRSILPSPAPQQTLDSVAPTSQLVLASPFPPAHQCTLVAAVNTRYEQRAQSLPLINELISSLWQQRPGRYLMAAPSYEYLQDIMACLTTNSSLPLLQQPAQQSLNQNIMAQRQQFMDALNAPQYLAGVIAGGLFAEGIDLQENRLDGVIIVGTCLPPPTPEREQIKARFDACQQQGFDFAYRYPGLNRVIQTAGRLIRSEQDRGVVLLLDDRFNQPAYRTLLPAHWQPRRMKNAADLQQALASFDAN